MFLHCFSRWIAAPAMVIYCSSGLHYLIFHVRFCSINVVFFFCLSCSLEALLDLSDV